MSAEIEQRLISVIADVFNADPAAITRETVADDVQEVTLKIEVSARSESGVHFVVDLSYAGLSGLRNVPQDALPPFLLIEAPRLLFPFARQVISEAVSNTGFPPLMLDPIDFAQMFQQKMAEYQAASKVLVS